MRGATHDLAAEANRLPPSPLRRLKAALLAAAAAVIVPTELAAQSVPTIWNDYHGSTSVPLTYAGYALNAGTTVFNNTSFPGSPQINVQITAPGAPNSSAPLPVQFTMDTGSTGIVIGQNAACNANMIQCNSNNQYSGPTSAILGYSSIFYASNKETFGGFYINANITVTGQNGATTTAQVPILVATNESKNGVANNNNPDWKFFGIGHDRGNVVTTLTNGGLGGAGGTTPQGSVVNTLYSKNLNPFLNLTALTDASGKVVNLSSVAPGYVVTSQGVRLGLDRDSISRAPRIALTALTQTPGSTVSTYAMLATANDWTQPAMLMKIANNAAGLDGSWYGTTIVDTGIGNSIIRVVPNPPPGSSTAGVPVNQALIQSAQQGSLTSIAIILGGVGSGNSSPLQFTYQFQGVCTNGSQTTGSNPTTVNAGCGPGSPNGAYTLSPLTSAPQPPLIGIYPISSPSSYDFGYNGYNTGFQDGTESGPYLNTGVNFLSYFDVIYDPVSGFMAYKPNADALASGLVSISPVMALAGSLQISAGAVVDLPVFLFTPIGNLPNTCTPGSGNQTGCVPQDVILSVENADKVTFNGQISSDTIQNCSSANPGGCSTGLVLNSGTFVLNAINTYAGATTVNSGATLVVNGSIATSSGLTVDQGGVVGGTGTLPTTVINGTLSPGNSIGTIKVNGNLTFGSTGTYLVELGPKASDHTDVTGTATLAGTVLAAFRPDTYKRERYTLLHADGGLGGTTFNALSTSGLPLNFDAALSYTPTDVMLDLTAHLGRDVNLPRHHKNIADAISNVFNNTGDLPPQFQALFNLTGGNLVNALSLISGEAATGAQQGAFQLGNQFLGIMLDPFVDGRAGLGGSDIPALGFAPGRKELPDDIALAYAQLLKAPPKPPSFEQRWSVWGAGYGGTNRTTGDPLVVGSHDLSARAAGFTAGFDYHLTRDTVIGFALAGGGTGWSLAEGLGGGKSDAFQAGVYGATRWGPAYLAGAFAFTNHWMSTDRFAFLNDHLSASFTAQSLGGRIEGGYRFGTMYGGIAPYAAIQAQSFRTPSYTETDLTNGGFGLSFNSRTAGDTRSELGARYDNAMRLDPYRVLAFRARLAWAHDWISDPTLAAVFQTLPGASFVVNGATPAKNSALTSAGAELRIANGFSFLAKFDGEFASHSSTYAGTGTVRYTW
jgi:autotransporter-associated beta strand protein